MEDKVKKIVEKVRNMYKFDERYNMLLKIHPTIKMKLNSSGEMKLVDISFSHFDKIIITETGIKYCPEIGSERILISYKGWDELLNL